MLSNPAWRMPVADFSRTVREWLVMPSPDSLMNLAIFLDAHAVAGDAALLAGVRDALWSLATDNDVMLARFAAAIDLFSGSGRWWHRLLGDGADRLDLKKEGIFPIVHGVRSLALAHRVADTATTERLIRLVDAQVLDADMARDLTDALQLLMMLKLKAGLAELDRGQAVSGAVDPQSLSTLERDLLKDALGVVKRFKALLRQRFRLNAL